MCSKVRELALFFISVFLFLHILTGIFYSKETVSGTHFSTETAIRE